MKKKKSRHSDINMRHCDINCDIATLTCVIDHKEEWLNCKRSYWNVIKVQATTNKKKKTNMPLLSWEQVSWENN